VPGMRNFDTEKTYDNVMHRFKFGGANTPGIYFDETVMRMCYTHRRLMAQLALHLVEEGQNEKAAEVLARAEQEFPQANVPHDYQGGSLDIIRSYVAIGQNDKAREILELMWEKSTQYVNYYCSLSPARFSAAQNDCMYHLYIMNHLADMASNIDEKLGSSYTNRLNELAGAYSARGGQF